MKHISNFEIGKCILGMAIGSSLFSIQYAEAKKSKPNVLIILADDQRADALGCSGNGYIKTPNIDAIAAEGVRFTNNYIMGGHHGAICAPSRSMLLSGKSLFNVYDKLDGVMTMPKYFSGFGYETFGTGKFHCLDGEKVFPQVFQKGKNVFIGGMCDHFNVPTQELLPSGKLSKPVFKSYSTDLFADAAIEYLNGYATGSKQNPFFCYVAFTAPHDPRSPRTDYVGMYPDATIPLPGNFMPTHPFAFEQLDIRDEMLGPWPRTPELIKSSLADYYALVSHLDKRVGDIIATLKKQNLLDNTIVLYMADNGLAIGSHGLLGKQNLYEHSMKVPLIFRGPGIPKNKVTPALTYLFDVFPTLCDLCKLPAPGGVNGKDISDVIKGKSKGVRESVFTAYRNTVRAVRTIDGWKLIRYPERDYTQLFNLNRDPLELVNLAKVDGHQAKVAELMTLMAKWQKETNDTSPLTAKTILPLEYDASKLNQKPDAFQPRYILDKYFKGVDLDKVKKILHD